MKIEINIEDIKKLEQARDAINEIISMNLSKSLEFELTEKNLKRAKKIKDMCSKGWVRAEIKIVSAAGTELTKII